MNKNNEHASEQAWSDRIATSEQDSNSDNHSEGQTSQKRVFSVSNLWKIRQQAKVFRIHNRLSRI